MTRPFHTAVPTRQRRAPKWEAYTLGRAPPTLDAGAELTTAEAAAAANLELARGAGSRYLVQRWGDGTFCDKMGRKRDVEVQASLPPLARSPRSMHRTR